MNLDAALRRVVNEEADRMEEETGKSYADLTSEERAVIGDRVRQSVPGRILSALMDDTKSADERVAEARRIEGVNA
jgi:hypothetical protein